MTSRRRQIRPFTLPPNAEIIDLDDELVNKKLQTYYINLVEGEDESKDVPIKMEPQDSAMEIDNLPAAPAPANATSNDTPESAHASAQSPAIKSRSSSPKISVPEAEQQAIAIDPDTPMDDAVKSSKSSTPEAAQPQDQPSPSMTAAIPSSTDMPQTSAISLATTKDVESEEQAIATDQDTPMENAEKSSKSSTPEVAQPQHEPGPATPAATIAPTDTAAPTSKTSTKSKNTGMSAVLRARLRVVQKGAKATQLKQAEKQREQESAAASSSATVGPSNATAQSNSIVTAPQQTARQHEPLPEDDNDLFVPERRSPARAPSPTISLTADRGDDSDMEMSETEEVAEQKVEEKIEEMAIDDEEIKASIRADMQAQRKHRKARYKLKKQLRQIKNVDGDAAFELSTEMEVLKKSINSLQRRIDERRDEYNSRQKGGYEDPSIEQFPESDEDEVIANAEAEAIAAFQTKKPGPRALDEEMHEVETENRGSRSNPHKRNTPKKPSGPKKPGRKPGRPKNETQPKERVAGSTSRVTKPAASKKGKGKDTSATPQATNTAILSSMLGSTVFEAQHAHQGASTTGLGGFSSGRKQEALRRLVASLPEDMRKQGRADQKDIDEAMREFNGTGFVRVSQNASEMVFDCRGLTAKLKPHQVLGAAFMRRRENDLATPRGGICADGMGLGKTVTMLANIVNDKLEKGKFRHPDAPKTTLIVATNALADQWYDEIKTHVDEKKCRLKVIKWWSKYKAAINNVPEYLSEQDIVLTTYDEVRRNYPKTEIPAECQTTEEKSKFWKEFFADNAGDLLRITFLRVVLDEAQGIKNHRSHTSIACRGLRTSKDGYRWALSGTPICNSLTELYPLFNFVRVENTGNYKVFCKNYIGENGTGTPDGVGVERINAMMSKYMIRRTHADQVMGHRIVELPSATEQLQWCEFNETERSVYEIVRSRMIKRINKMSRSKTLDANYSHVLTMLLRLRQLTAHVLMLQGTLKDLLEREDHEKILEIAQADGERTKAFGKGALSSLRMAIAAQTKEAMDQSGPTAGSAIANAHYVGEKHGMTYDFLKYMRDLRKDSKFEELKARSVCVVCGDKPEPPMITACFHLYCQECLESIISAAAAEERDGARCVECHVVFGGSRKCDSLAIDHYVYGDEELDNELSDTDTELRKINKPKRKTTKKGKKGSKKKDVPDLLLGIEADEEKSWIAEDGNPLPSAKTIALKAQILNWIEQDADVKIIVFSQFLDMLHLIRRICIAESWGCVMYHGQQSVEKRKANVEDFKNPAKNIRIMLASLKCGGVGLNLTMASKVVITDIWWNREIDEQAFCRVFRIGQIKETHLTRLVVKGTVDANMVDMQVKKKKEINQVMGPGHRARQLTVKELLQLFGGGEVREDEAGQPYIFVDERETRPNPMAANEDEDMFDVA